MKYILTIALSILFISVIAQEEQLIIFTQPSDKLFLSETLSQISSFTETEDIQLLEFSAKDGLPKNITSTPAIIYRNDKGASTFAGRYTSMSTIKNFIRSARVITQKITTLKKENTYLMESGKMQIAASIKITDLQYLDQSISPGIRSDDFLQYANQGIKNGLKDFQLKEFIQLKRTDRIFYLDFHPYLVNKDSLILSLELYSQFSCIDPIYKSLGLKVMGSDISDVFKQASVILKNEILKSLSSSTIGDGHSPVLSNNRIKELQNFEIINPVSSSNEFAAVDPNRKLPKQWIYKSAVSNKLPILQFNFIEPLTRYAGEISLLKGSIGLNSKNKLINGLFEATMKSLTMGEESFDKKVLKEYVKARSNPKSIFTTNEIINPEPLEWLKTTSITATGSMSLMKKSKPITVEANITPYIDQAGDEVLLVQANWSMNITDGWDIEGPDGPDPAKKTLEFSMNILMQPSK